MICQVYNIILAVTLPKDEIEVMRLRERLFCICIAFAFNFVTSCKPLRLNNPGDTWSSRYLETLSLQSLTRPVSTQAATADDSIITFQYDKTLLVGETGKTFSETATPNTSGLNNCQIDTALPQGLTLNENGIIASDGTQPQETSAKLEKTISCKNSTGINYQAKISTEVKGISWVKNLTSTGFSSAIYEAKAFNANEIFFVGTISNNGTNWAQDFSQNITKSSYPTPGTSVSPIIFKLNAKGELLYNRYIAGADTLSSARIGLDDQGNQYLLSMIKNNLQINIDSEFGGTAVNQTVSNVNSTFLLSRINYDGTFSYAKTVSANTLTEANSFCYNSQNQNIYIGGRANGTLIDYGFDFSVTDTGNTPAGFLLELTKGGNYVTNRKFLGSTHVITDINCLNDGAIVLAINQVSTSLDYRTPFDGIADIKNATNGTAVTRVNSGNSYQFTKTIFNPGNNVTPRVMATDADGNSYIGFQSNATSIDIRINIDGISDIKTVNGGIDFYIVKISPAGNYVWGRRIGGLTSDQLYAMKIRPSDGHIFITGTFSGANQPLYGDFGIADVHSTISGQSNSFIMEITKDGSFVRHIPISSSSVFLVINHMEFDSEENLYLSGSFGGAADFRYSTGGKLISKSFTYTVPQGFFIKLRP
ncbi:hypothetical protein EHQ58_16475 [Leptospira ognonensis]|uniref:Uncharacterized protein n=1 Tax=Leptospira ognonensis TaxID=2484945 RepID=A0A4R9JTY8_9LEPT|nr:hypothetical protein [Leptospira ognonensis]TGL56232.1 hypothetical protein EHQ58_16475 [Leptospira ognonensis]